MTFESLLFDTLTFTRKTDVRFTGLIGSSNILTYTGRDARLAVTNSTGATATLTFTGKKDGVTVTNAIVLVGNDDDLEGSQVFDEVISFTASFASGSVPNVSIITRSRSGEPIQQTVSVLTDEPASVSVRNSFVNNPVDNPGQIGKTEAKIRIGELGVTVARYDLFTHEEVDYIVNRRRRIFDAETGTHHWEFIGIEVQ